MPVGGRVGRRWPVAIAGYVVLIFAGILFVQGPRSWRPGRPGGTGPTASGHCSGDQPRRDPAGAADTPFAHRHVALTNRSHTKMELFHPVERHP